MATSSERAFVEFPDEGTGPDETATAVVELYSELFLDSAMVLNCRAINFGTWCLNLMADGAIFATTFHETPSGSIPHSIPSALDAIHWRRVAEKSVMSPLQYGKASHKWNLCTATLRSHQRFSDGADYCNPIGLRAQVGEGHDASLALGH